MPIRINLLAEARIAEDLRRRDPVKRAIFGGAFLVVLFLVWSSSLQLEAMISKKALNDLETEISSRTNEYQNVVASQKRIFEASRKVAALGKMESSRFLQGNLLNGLQQATVNGVQLLRIRVDQSYFNVEGSPAQTNNNHVIMGHPAMTTEKIVLSLDARDFSANPGDQVNRFKDAIAGQSYFKAMLSTTNGIQLTSLSPPENGNDGKSYVQFALECNFPEQNRENPR
jgi:hypothetical protein